MHIVKRFLAILSGKCFFPNVTAYLFRKYAPSTIMAVVAKLFS
jgi:hypothetical protein